ncbi:MAG TPA: undecaprenyl-diphosphatase UppP [Verrucomicrobiae bacterium]|nr:undecaprenyl-diphosphatase UppP [Verrucomicrobiae bacterium]
MTLLQAAVFGLIQGLTEFLPISSAAHLRIVSAFLGWTDPGTAFTAVIQLAIVVTLLAYFWHDLVRIAAAMLRGAQTGRLFDDHDARLGWMIVVGTLPIMVLGLAFKKHVETSLRSLYVIAFAEIGLALALIVAEYLERFRVAAGTKLGGMKDITWTDAIIVGVVQCLALIPGASRSGSTITGGLFVGFTRETAARFSFLLALPSFLGAGVLEFVHHRHELLAVPGAGRNLVVATVVAIVVGYGAVAFLMNYLKRHTTWLFIIYRLILGAGLLALLASGRLQAF